MIPIAIMIILAMTPNTFQPNESIQFGGGQSDGGGAGGSWQDDTTANNTPTDNVNDPIVDTSSNSGYPGSTFS